MWAGKEKNLYFNTNLAEVINLVWIYDKYSLAEEVDFTTWIVDWFIYLFLCS